MSKPDYSKPVSDEQEALLLALEAEIVLDTVGQKESARRLLHEFVMGVGLEFHKKAVALRIDAEWAGACDEGGQWSRAKGYYKKVDLLLREIADMACAPHDWKPLIPGKEIYECTRCKTRKLRTRAAALRKGDDNAAS